MREHVWYRNTRLHKFYVFCLWIVASFCRNSEIEREDFIEKRRHDTNICALIRCMIFGPVILLLNISGNVLFLYAISFPFIYLDAINTITVLLIIIGAISTATGLLYLFMKYIILDDDMYELFEQGYISIKDKTCFLIKFKEFGVKNDQMFI